MFRGFTALLVVAVAGQAYVAPLALRCDGNSINSDKGPMTFSIMIDPAKRLVLDMGLGPGVETTQFSETAITASQKDAGIEQLLIIDRITGQFHVLWMYSNEKINGKDFEGVCGVTERKF